jgi:antimicrobial peptide system SdpA family protein
MNVNESTPLAVKMTFVTVLASLLVIVGYVGLNSLPHNPMRDETHVHPGYVRLLPQGWGFFTKNAQDPGRTLYLPSDDGWEPVEWRRTQLALGWGLSRRPTIEMMELSVVLDGVWDAVEEDCEEEPLACVGRYSDVLEVENPLPDPTLCGLIAVVQQPPAPWAWREFEGLHMPSSVAVLRVAC